MYDYIFEYDVKSQCSGIYRFETGAVFTGYNNVRIPGDAGTLFSLKDDLTPKPNAFIRLRAGYAIGKRHTISLLYAPLTIKSDGSINKQIDFEGVTFLLTVH